MIKKETFCLLWPFFLYKLLKGALFITTITFFVFFLQKGITYFEASILLGLQFSMPAFFEVITGLIADTFGRKISVLLGISIEIFILLGIILASNYFTLFVLFVLWGIAGTFTSGADDAWAIETMPGHKRKAVLDEYYSASASAFSFGMIIAGLLSTLLLTSFGQGSVWIARATIALLMFLLLLFVKENFAKSKNRDIKGVQIFTENMRESFFHFKEERQTRNIILGELFVTIALVGAGGAALQGYLLESQLPSVSWGSVYSIAALAGIGVPFLAMMVSRKFKSKKKYLITILTGHGLLLLIAGLVLNPIFAIFFIFAHNLAEDFFNPVSVAFFQQKIPSQVRATLTSLHSMSLGVGSLVGMLGGGFLTHQFGGQITIAIAPLFLIPAIIFYFRIS